MENSLEVIENIMKPYFDKKAEMNRLRLSLERLQENKEREIEEYLSSNFMNSQSVYSGYEAMIRRDLEAAYKKKEESLKVYKNVDLREMVELKGELRKKLIAEQKKLSVSLKEQQLLFDTTMFKLNNLKIEHDEQYQVINGSDIRTLFDESNKIIDKMSEIKKALQKIEEYLKVTNLTQDETAAVMRTMAPWEKEEYDRRKTSQSKAPGNFEQIPEPTPEPMPEMIEQPKQEESDIVEINDPVISEYEEKDGNVVVDNVMDLVKTIYNDIVDTATKMDYVKLNSSKGKLGENEFYVSSKTTGEDYNLNGVAKLSEDSIELPCGEYVNLNDINKALNDLYKKNKGKTYTVKETGKTLNIVKSKISKLKRKLKKCVTVKLIKDKKISKLDLLKRFGKNKTNKIINEIDLNTLDNVNVEEGEYINRNELISNLDNLFSTKKIEWLKSVSSSLKEKGSSFIDKFRKKQEESSLDIDDDFRIRQK